MFDFSNITSVTRSLVNTLRCQDPDGAKINITCAVLDLDGKVYQTEDAEAEHVDLKGATLPQGDEMITPEIRWINQLSSSYYERLLNENSFNFIIGHAPLLAHGAANLKANCKGENPPKVVLMIHTLPKTEKGLINKNLLCTWMEGTDIVFSIGETDSNILKRFIYGKIHEIYIPICPLKHSRKLSESESTMSVKSGDTTPKITVMVGRKESGYNGIDIKLVVAAVGQAVERAFNSDNKVETYLTFVGRSAD